MLIYSGNILLSASDRPQFLQPLCQTFDLNNTLPLRVGVRHVLTRMSDITCALCLIPTQSTIFVHYGNSVCPVGWILVYSGLMVVPTGADVATPICATTNDSNLRERSSVSFLTDENENELACSVCSM